MGDATLDLLQPGPPDARHPNHGGDDRRRREVEQGSQPGAAGSVPLAPGRPVTSLRWFGGLLSAPLWAWYLGAGLLTTAFALHWVDRDAYLLFNLTQLIGALVTLVGVRRYRPSTGLAWQLIALGFAAGALANCIWTVMPDLRGVDGFLAALGALYLVKEMFFALGLTMIAGRGGEQCWVATLDGAIVATGATVALWAFVARPIIHSGRFSATTTGAAIGFVAVDLVLLAVLARMLFMVPIRSVPALLLGGSAGLVLVGDAGYAAGLSSSSPFSPSGTSLLAWMLSALLIAAAAMHPAMVEVKRAPVDPGGASRLRMITFIGLAVLGPVIAAVIEVTSGTGTAALAWADILVPALLTMVLSVLLVLRLGLLLRFAHGRAGALARSLAAQERLQRQLSHRALHDPLTGLGNRALLVERLEQCLSPGDPPAARRVSLLMLDLDGFKDVNDTLGHPVGDELLIEVSRRLRAEVRATDTLVRLGGDEFAIMATGADPAEARRLADRALAEIRRPFQIGEREIFLTTSIGLLQPAVGSCTASDALRDADVALYAAKSAGKNQVVVFDDELRHRQAERARLSAGLRRPGVYQELELHYQPVVDLATGRPYAVEALLRWNPAGAPSIPPMAFVPVAEATGLIVPIGRWVLERALQQVKPWYLSCGVAVSVNVSALQLTAQTFADDVLEVLDANGVPGEALIIELTESVLISEAVGEAAAVRASLARLRRHGVRIAVDDFGTGFSSLSYLVQLPVDILKIDQMFIGYLGGTVPDAAGDTGAGSGAVTGSGPAVTRAITGGSGGGRHRVRAHVPEAPGTGPAGTGAHQGGAHGLGVNGERDRRPAALIRAILDVGRSLRLETIAEGIETAEQANRLRAMDCPLAQGYLFSRPVPASRIEEYLGLSPQPAMNS